MSENVIPPLGEIDPEPLPSLTDALVEALPQSDAVAPALSIEAEAFVTPAAAPVTAEASAAAESEAS